MNITKQLFVSAILLGVGFAGLSRECVAEEPALLQAEKIGVKVGESAPAFELKDAAGEVRSLKSFTDKGTVALVFHRSAGWCPFCQKELIALQADLEKFEKAGVQVVAISYDKQSVLKRFAEEHSIEFPLLSDEASKVIDAYGIRNKESKAGTMQDGIPYPGVVLVDGEGVIKALFFYQGYSTRADHKKVIEAAKE